MCDVRERGQTEGMNSAIRKRRKRDTLNDNQVRRFMLCIIYKFFLSKGVTTFYVDVRMGLAGCGLRNSVCTK